MHGEYALDNKIDMVKFLINSQLLFSFLPINCWPLVFVKRNTNTVITFRILNRFPLQMVINLENF